MFAKFKSSIAVKLFSSFVVIVFLSIAASVSGNYVFNVVSQATDRVLEERLPLLQEMGVLSEAVNDVAGLSKEYENVSTNDELAKIEFRSVHVLTMAKGALKRITSLYQDENAQKLANVVAGLEKNLKEQAELADMFLTSQGHYKLKADIFDKSISEIAKMSSPLVSDVVTVISGDLMGVYDAIDLQKVTPDTTQTIERLMDIELYKMGQLFDIRLQAERVASLIRSLHTEGDAKAIGEIAKQAGEGFLVLKRRIAAIDNPDRQRLIKKELDNLSPMINNRGNIFESRLQIVSRAQTLADLGAQNIQAAQELKVNVQRIKKDVEIAVKGAGEDLTQSVAAGQQTLVGLAVIAVVLSLVIAIFVVQRGIVSRLKELDGIVHELSSGNLDVDVTVSGSDEIGRLGEMMSGFKLAEIEKIKLQKQHEKAKDENEKKAKEQQVQIAAQFEREVLTLVEEVVQSSQVVLDETEKLTQVVKLVNEQSSEVSSETGNVTGHVTGVSGATEEMSASVAEISAQVHEVVKLSDVASSSAQSSQEKMQELSKAAEAIGDVVTLISEVAEKTNLLALNATIEAARAGEAGKGFAVVASEVKGLAQQTASAMEQIAKHVSEMQNTVSEAVVTSDRIYHVIQELDAITATVSGAVEQQRAASEEISQSSQLAAEVTAGISMRINEVSTATETASDGCEVMHSSGANLSERAHKMRNEVQAFIMKLTG